MLAMYKITFKQKETVNGNLLRKINHKKKIIKNHKGTRIVKDGENKHRVKITNLK